MTNDDMLRELRTFVTRYPQATLADVMAEFDLTDAEAEAALHALPRFISVAATRYTFAQVVELHDMLASGRVGGWWISSVTHRYDDPRGPGYDVELCLGPCVQRILLAEYQDIERVVAFIEKASGGDGQR